jgi:hypothetical protein
MLKVNTFETSFARLLPETHALMRSANLTVHPLVRRITLHGSRGLAGGCRPDSDIDLSLIADLPPGADMEDPLRDVLETALNSWRAAVEPDLAVVFDIRGCGLSCFDRQAWDQQVCTQGGIDCFGLYKTQRGFHGLVVNAGIQVKLMYPCLRIWQRT